MIEAGKFAKNIKYTVKINKIKGRKEENTKGQHTKKTEK